MGCIERGKMKVKKKKERKVIAGRNKTVIACTLAPAPTCKAYSYLFIRIRGQSYG